MEYEREQLLDIVIIGSSLDNYVNPPEDKTMAKPELTAQALEQFARLPRGIQERVRKILHRLESWPNVSGAKPLSGNLAGWYRLRTGDYRIRFYLQGDLIIVDQIGHRSSFYED
jgi:mRNA interferase RelE/StbE